APPRAPPRSNTVPAAPRCARRQAIDRPMTPAPITTAAGAAFTRFLPMAIGGSLRWHDPDRFDGFDLSRATRGTPGLQPYDGGFRAPRQGRQSMISESGYRVSERIMLQKKGRSGTLAGACT